MTDRVGSRFTLPMAAPLCAPLAQASQEATWLLWFLAILGALSFVAVVILLIVMATRKGTAGYGPPRDRGAYPGPGYPPAPPPPWAEPPAPYPPSPRPPAAAPPPYPGPVPSPAPPSPGYPPWPARPPGAMPPPAVPYDRPAAPPSPAPPAGSQPGPYGAPPPAAALQSGWNRPAAESPAMAETGFQRAREQHPASMMHPSLAETVMALHPSAAPPVPGKPEAAAPPPGLNAAGKPSLPKSPAIPCSPYSETVSVPPPARAAIAQEEEEAAAETVKQTLVEDFDTSERLVAETGPLAGSSFPLFGKIRIGRAPDNDIVLADKKVSSHHAMINRMGPKLVVTDLNSTNGTVLNGIRITDPVEALYGDKLIVGDTRFDFS